MKGWYYRRVDDGLNKTVYWHLDGWRYHSEACTTQEFLKLAKEDGFDKDSFRDDDDDRILYLSMPHIQELGTAVVVSDHEFLIEMFDMETRASQGMMQYKVFESDPDGENEE